MFAAGGDGWGDGAAHGDPAWASPGWGPAHGAVPIAWDAAVPRAVDLARPVAEAAVEADCAGETEGAVRLYICAIDELFDAAEEVSGALARAHSPCNDVELSLRVMLDTYITRAWELTLRLQEEGRHRLEEEERRLRAEALRLAAEAAACAAAAAARAAAAADLAAAADSSSESDHAPLPRSKTWVGAMRRRLDFRKAGRLIIMGLRLGLKVGSEPGTGLGEKQSVDIDRDPITGEDFLTLSQMPPSAAETLAALFPMGRQPHILWAAEICHRTSGSFGRTKESKGRVAMLTPEAFYIGSKRCLERCVELCDVSEMVCEEGGGWAALRVPRHYDVVWRQHDAGRPVPEADAKRQLARLWGMLAVLIRHHQRKNDRPPIMRAVRSLGAEKLQVKAPKDYAAPRNIEIPVGKRQKRMEVDVISASGLIVQDMASSDPYIVVRYAGEQHQTEVQSSTLDPVWGKDGKGEAFVFPLIDQADTMEFTCYDYDLGQGGGDGDFMGVASLHPFNLPQGWRDGKGTLALTTRTSASGEPEKEDVKLLREAVEWDEKKGKPKREHFGTLTVRIRPGGQQLLSRTPPRSAAGGSMPTTGSMPTALSLSPGGGGGLAPPPGGGGLSPMTHSLTGQSGATGSPPPPRHVVRHARGRRGRVSFIRNK